MSARHWMWDQHACLPLIPGTPVAPLARFLPGTGYVSVNVGYAPQPKAEVLALLASFRGQVAERAEFELAGDVDELRRIVDSGRLAVAFDLEDSNPLEGNLDNVAAFVALGVRTMLPSYNHANAAGGGCLDAVDTGLTAYGRDLVRAMNEAGMVPDGSHCARRTGLDLCAVSTKPVVYSHSCLDSVWPHPRNITDDQARACADTGGVVGITGVGIFLGPTQPDAASGGITPTIPAMVQHLEAAVNLVGIDHVGISTDFPFDATDFLAELAANPHLFDESYTRWGPLEFMPPETFLTLGDALAARGWSADDVGKVLSGNFLRVAVASW